jgi:ribosomal protein L11 methyltransferase
MYQVHALMDRASAERLSNLLANGFDESPASAVSVEEVSKTSWRLDAWCSDYESAEGVAAILVSELPGVRPAVMPLEDKDWVAMSLEGLPAVEAGPFIVAGAHELAKAGGGRIPVWIEAGPAFGTGHHGTTKGCLLALSDLARTRKLGRVLDIGAGSGVLAIAALKAGADSALATDIDRESVRIARENARNNRCGPRLKLLLADGANNAAIRNGAPYDLVMANILAKPLVMLSHDIARLVKPGGRIILSGLLAFQEPQVKAAYRGQGLTLVSASRLNGWSTLVYARPQKPPGKGRSTGALPRGAAGSLLPQTPTGRARHETDLRRDRRTFGRPGQPAGAAGGAQVARA